MSVKEVIKEEDGKLYVHRSQDVQKILDHNKVQADIQPNHFGELSLIPSRFQRARDAFVLDPEHMEVAYLSTLTQKPLARTGHSERRLLSVEFGSYVFEKAHGVIADLNA